MRPPVIASRALTVVALVLGAQLLMADSCTGSSGCYDAAAANATFQLSGDCGATGIITVSGEAGTCNLHVS